MLNDALFSLVYNVVSRSVVFIVNFIAVRVLLVEDYGALGYVMGVVASLVAVSSFGSGVAVNVIVGGKFDSDPAFVKRFVSASFLFSLVLAGLVLLVLLPFFLSGDIVEVLDRSGLVLIGILVFAMSLNGSAEGALNGAREFKTVAKNSLISFVLIIPFTYFFIKNFGVLGALLLIVLYRAFLAFLNVSRVLKVRLLESYSVIFAEGGFDVRVLRGFLSIGLPSMLGGIMVAPMVAMSMRFVGDHGNGLDELAYFSWVYQIYVISVFVPSALGGVLISRFSRARIGNDLVTILLISIFLSCIVALFLFGSKSWILGFAGAEYVKGAAGVFDLMVYAAVLFSANSVFASYWPSKGKAWLGFAMNFLWAIMMVSITWSLARDMGAEALGMAFLASYAVLLLVQLTVAFSFGSNEHGGCI